jgi:hypothetical protein
MRAVMVLLSLRRLAPAEITVLLAVADPAIRADRGATGAAWATAGAADLRHLGPPN